MTALHELSYADLLERKPRWLPEWVWRREITRLLSAERARLAAIERTTGLTPEHQAAMLRWWDKYVGGEPDWAWLLRDDEETRAFLAKSPHEVAGLFR